MEVSILYKNGMPRQFSVDYINYMSDDAIEFLETGAKKKEKIKKGSIEAVYHYNGVRYKLFWYCGNEND